ncbi:8-oxo-dGTP diphosphatase [Desulfomicrobium apsheronum]|uniref:8-oxo-dGTP diphosphatase n=1 Tax=Desulfomicrobium apsheronum TaxID=52560 RepID=A0A1I3TR99_9BACT|nr:NUDIX hydrolase [Desulfomicrobium apsheronum]MDY0226064.1 NUDIX hydrolase [Desulfomicrobium apsheronum]SFJ73003.1 8-oxo-dGTP diphosphatase [Desulfomicrobium apsheronum]
MHKTRSFSCACTRCGAAVAQRNPFPTVDIVLYRDSQGILLIERGNPPHGWALPGGFIDCGESAEQAAVREALEETGLVVRLTGLLGVYSDPDRDPRFHTLSVAYTAECDDDAIPCAGDDARNARFFPLDALPTDIAFDHRRIIADFAKKLSRSA